MTETDDTSKPPELIVVSKRMRSPDYNCIYAVGAEGGNLGPYDIRIHFYDVDIENNKEADQLIQTQTRIIKGSVILSYAAAQQLSDWLIKRLELYEKESGRPIYTGDVAEEQKS